MVSILIGRADLAAASPVTGFLDHAERIARAIEGQRDECPPSHPWPAPGYFRFNEGGAFYVAEAGIALAIPLRQARDRIEKLDQIPSWALLSEEGTPILRELTFDPRTGLASIQLGDELWEAQVTRERRGSSAGTRFEMLNGKRVKEAALELAALPAPNCQHVSVLTVRLTWKLGLLARLFGGGMKIMPALLAIRVRDDFAASALSEDWYLREAAGILLERQDSGLRRIEEVGGIDPGQVMQDSPPPMKGDVFLRALPGGATVDPDRLEPWNALLQKEAGRSVRFSDFVRALYEALQGRHMVDGVIVNVRRGVEQVENAVARLKSDQIQYSVIIDVRQDRSRIAIVFGW